MLLQSALCTLPIFLSLVNGINSIASSQSFRTVYRNSSATSTVPRSSSTSSNAAGSSSVTLTVPHSSVTTSSSSRTTSGSSSATLTANSSGRSNSGGKCSISQPPVRNQLTNNAPFSFSIPYNTPQACDIYGPTCQTGSITVDVSLGGCQSTPTVLPCSSYLSSQAQYLRAFDAGATRSDAQFLPIDWQRNFGRSPECRDYKKTWVEKGSFNFPGCPASYSTSGNDSIPLEIPPGYPPAATYLKENIYDKVGIQCCGDCGLRVPRVHIFYFPDANASSYCQANGRQLGFAGPASESRILPNYSPLRNAANGAVPTQVITSGITMISPSVYMKVEGTMSVHDGCGAIGPSSVDPVYSFDPGELSTFVLPTTTASLGYLTSMAQLQVADLECPSMGLAKVDIGTTTEWGIDYSYELGPPWLPIIAPPSKIIDSNPEWKSRCPGVASKGYARYVGMYDPPSVLVPAENLVDPKLLQPEPTPAAQYSHVDDPAEPVKENPSLPLATPSVKGDDYLGVPNFNGDPSYDLKPDDPPVPVQPSSPQPGSKPDSRPDIVAPEHNSEPPIDLPNFFSGPPQDGSSSTQPKDINFGSPQKPDPKSSHDQPHIDPVPGQSSEHQQHESSEVPNFFSAPQQDDHSLSQPGHAPPVKSDQSFPHVEQQHNPDPPGHPAQSSKHESDPQHENSEVPDFFHGPQQDESSFPAPKAGTPKSPGKSTSNTDQLSPQAQQHPHPDSHTGDDPHPPSEVDALGDSTDNLDLPNFFDTPPSNGADKSIPVDHGKHPTSSAGGKGDSVAGKHDNDGGLTLPNFSPKFGSETHGNGVHHVAEEHTDTLEVPNFFDDPIDGSTDEIVPDEHTSTPPGARKGGASDGPLALPNFSPNAGSKDGGSGSDITKGSDPESIPAGHPGSEPPHDEDGAFALPNFFPETGDGDSALDDFRDDQAASSVATTASFSRETTSKFATSFTSTGVEAPVSTSFSGSDTTGSNAINASASLWAFESAGTTMSVTPPLLVWVALIVGVAL